MKYSFHLDSASILPPFVRYLGWFKWKRKGPRQEDFPGCGSGALSKLGRGGETIPPKVQSKPPPGERKADLQKAR